MFSDSAQHLHTSKSIQMAFDLKEQRVLKKLKYFVIINFIYLYLQKDGNHY